MSCTMASSLIHSKVDYCNLLLLNLPASSLRRFQIFLNSTARTVAGTSLSSLLSLNVSTGLKLSDAFTIKILSPTYKARHIHCPTYLRSLLAIQDICNTHSASIVSLVHPANPSRFEITNRFFLSFGYSSVESSSNWSLHPFAKSYGKFFCFSITFCIVSFSVPC